MRPRERPGRGRLHRGLEALGAAIVGAGEEVGRFFFILYKTLFWTFRRPFDLREWARQMV